MADEKLLQQVFDLMHEDAIKQGYKKTKETRDRIKSKKGVLLSALDQLHFMSFRAGWFTAMQGVLDYLKDQEMEGKDNAQVH